MTLAVETIAPAGSAAAATKPPASIAISPIYQNISLDLNQPETKYVVTIKNQTSVNQAFKLSTIDFGSLNESGGVAFLGTSSGDFAKQYGLSKWMRLDQEAVTVPAGGKIQVGVTVANSDALKPGGHYGAVLATALTAPGGPPAKSRVGVLEVLSSLVLLVKNGGAPANLKLVGQTVDKSGWRLPSQVEDRFQNVGSVHVVPRGVLEVRDPLGRLVERGALNADSGVILPQTFRRYTTPLTMLSAAWLPGRYTVKALYRFDGTTSIQTYESTFWYAGPAYCWAGIAAGLLVTVALAWWLVRRKRR